MPTKYITGDKKPILIPVDSAQVINQGDLVLLETDDVRAFSSLSDAGSEAVNQAAAVSKFVGVAMATSQDGQTNPIQVATAGIWEFDAVSGTYEIGSLVGPNGTGSGEAVGVSDTEVVAVTDDAYAIGRVAKRGTTVTRVRVNISSTILKTTENEASGANTLTTGAGAGITAGTGTVYKNSTSRNGGVITTQILIDLTGLHSEATDLDIIGVDGSASAAHIGRITEAQNGTILGGTIRCLEVPAGGDPNVALYAAAEGTGVEDSLISALTEAIVFDPAGDWTIDMSRSFTGIPAAGDYLYLVQGDATGTDADYTAGKFLITLYGY